jgi:hypothetical protein
VITAGAPASGTSAIITLTSHREQRSRVSFRINGKERRFSSELVEDQKYKVSGSTPRYLYSRGKRKRSFGTHVRDNVWCARHLGLLTILTVQCPTHYEWGPSPRVNNINPTDVVRQQGRWSITPMTLKGVRTFHLFDEEIPTSHRCDAMLHEQHKSDKELPFITFFFFLSPG